MSYNAFPSETRLISTSGELFFYLHYSCLCKVSDGVEIYSLTRSSSSVTKYHGVNYALATKVRAAASNMGVLCDDIIAMCCHHAAEISLLWKLIDA